MRVLVTGACGFVGRHLAAELTTHGHEVVLATHTATQLVVAGKTFSGIPCDVRDAEAVRRLVTTTRPDAVAHLAGLAQIVDAAKDRANLAAVNTMPIQHFCAAIVAEQRAQIPLLFVSSSFVYGDHYHGRVAISEQTPTKPNTPYGHSKLAAEFLGQVFEGDALAFYIARPFNHIGPGQATSFVCPSFAQRILRTPPGGTIEVGNLSARRDFCDVRDIVRAYRLILEKRPASRLFVLGSGRSLPISDILAQLVRISGKDIKSVVNSGLYRDNDACDMLADLSLASRELGWGCEIPLSRSLADVYHDVALHDKIKQ